jgi:hypothetical protein
MMMECETVSAQIDPARGLDLEEYRQAHGLSYRKLAALIGSGHASQTRSWAIGESRPDADQAEAIIRKTNGIVTIEALHRRRLAWLRENNKCTIAADHEPDPAPNCNMPD